MKEVRKKQSQLHREADTDKIEIENVKMESDELTRIERKLQPYSKPNSRNTIKKENKREAEIICCPSFSFEKKKPRQKQKKDVTPEILGQKKSRKK